MSWKEIPCVSGAEGGAGHFSELSARPLSLLRRAASEARDCPIRLAVGSAPFLVLTGPRLTELTLIDPDRLLFKPKMELWSRVVGQSLLSSNGEEWEQARKRTLQVFERRYVVRHAKIVAEVADYCTRPWATIFKIDVLQEMRKLTLLSSIRSFCGASDSVDVAAFTRSLATVMEYIQLRETSPVEAEPPVPLEQQFTEAVHYLRSTVMSLMEAHRGETNDLISHLLTYAEVHAGSLTNDQMCDDILAMLIAGYESTATALAWTLILVSAAPPVQSRLRNELSTMSGECPANFCVSQQLPYTHAVFAEALRLFPPSWCTLRASSQSLTLAGARIPRGSLLLTCQYTNHRDARWFEHPDEFIPERWLDRGVSNLPRFAFFPFGGGRRACPGQRMAKTTAYAVISHVFKRFRTQLISKVEPAVSVTLQPNLGASLQVSALRD